MIQRAGPDIRLRRISFTYSYTTLTLTLAPTRYRRLELLELCHGGSVPMMEIRCRTIENEEEQCPSFE
jgi:hypothetical protein